VATITTGCSKDVFATGFVSSQVQNTSFNFLTGLCQRVKKKDQAYNNAGDEIDLRSVRSKNNTQFYFFSR